LCNPAAAACIKSVDIIRQAGLEVSDHAPAILDLDL
jgi:exonuclease III